MVASLLRGPAGERHGRALPLRLVAAVAVPLNAYCARREEREKHLIKQPVAKEREQEAISWFPATQCSSTDLLLVEKLLRVVRAAQDAIATI